MTDDPQGERARGAYEIHIDVAPASNDEFDQLRKSLRLSRADIDWLRDHLPGVVRRGARVDLEPVVTRLRAAGHAATLRPRAAALAPSPKTSPEIGS